MSELRKYKVTVEQKLEQYGEVIVEAHDEDEAWEMAYELANKGDDRVRWDRNSYGVVDDSAECVEVEEVTES